MGKQIVDKSGFLLLGTSADPDSLFDGTQVKQASLTLTSKIATAQAVGEAYADEAVVSKSYEISGTAYYPSDGAHSLFAVGDTSMPPTTRNTPPPARWTRSCSPGRWW